MFKKLDLYLNWGYCLNISIISLPVWGVADDQEWQHVTICSSYVSDDYTASIHYISLSIFVHLWNIPYI